MEIKYEAVFGSQELFDGAEPDVFLVETNGVYKTFHKETTGKVSIWTKSGCDLAMRRIIRTPTWSLADQKAGRLPEVGCLVVNKTGKVSEVVTIKNGYFVLFECGKRNGPLTIHGDLLMKQFKPIETPEEKAQRLEDEFVASITKCTSTDGYSSGYIEGLRAAYRKLKGGE